MGVPELFIFGPFLVILGVPLIGLPLCWLWLVRRSRRAGYRSVLEYARAVPQSDAAKRDAANLATVGLMWALLGVFWAPFVLVGLIPFFFGARKVTYALMGLGLVQDGDQPGL